MVKGVMELANEFMEEPNHVWINDEGIQAYCAKIREEINKDPYFMGEPNIPLPDDEFERVKKIVLHELIASSVNYKYWYGKYNIRPNDSSATTMYKMLGSAFNRFDSEKGYLQYVIWSFRREMTQARFPMIRERVAHLNEVAKHGELFAQEVATAILDEKPVLSYLLENLIVTFPGFAEDIFLKRAFLFFMMLYRRMDWFSDEIHGLPIPADYQIPKILQAEGCLDYCCSMKNDITEGKLILKGSSRECEIRAGSIIACQKIATECGVSMCKVDDYLWLKRKEYDVPFHLTITTDY